MNDAVHNDKNQNCYSLATTLAPKTNSNSSFDIFDMNCVYGGVDSNKDILKCASFSSADISTRTRTNVHVLMY